MTTKNIVRHDINPSFEEPIKITWDDTQIALASDAYMQNELRQISKVAEIVSLKKNTLGKPQFFEVMAATVAKLANLNTTEKRVFLSLLKAFDLIGDKDSYKLTVNHQYILELEIDDYSYRTFALGIENLCKKEIIYHTKFRDSFYLNKKYFFIPKQITIIGNYNIVNDPLEKVNYSGNLVGAMNLETLQDN